MDNKIVDRQGNPLILNRNARSVADWTPEEVARGQGNPHPRAVPLRRVHIRAPRPLWRRILDYFFPLPSP